MVLLTCEKRYFGMDNKKKLSLRRINSSFGYIFIIYICLQSKITLNNIKVNNLTLILFYNWQDLPKKKQVPYKIFSMSIV